jgi:uncharacterized protein YhaN
MRRLALEVLPERAAVECDLSEIAVAAAKLGTDIDGANAGLGPLSEAAEQTRALFEALHREFVGEQRELQTKTDALADGRRRDADEALAAKADELERNAQKQRASVIELEERVGEPIVDIDAQIKRLENSARIYQNEAARLRAEIARSSATIIAGEGDGVEEELENARAEELRLNKEIEDCKREIAVLQLLRDTLRTAESEAKALYLAPVTTRVEPYLRVLIPGTNLMLDEDLHIARLKRNGMEEDFTRLSDGTQEQIAVLTRLAFAELLLDQGRPATVILDDALVFSDDERIERMFNIMTRAAERLQIIVLTCRKRLFTRLGAPLLNIKSSDLTMAA